VPEGGQGRRFRCPRHRTDTDETLKLGALPPIGAIVDTDRRQGCALRFEPEAGVLVVGNRTAVVDGPSATDVVVGRYVELVVSQRAQRPGSHIDLRNDELAALADLLALAPTELDERIDRELDRLLGRLGTGDTGSDRSRVWRRLVFAALLGTAVAAGAAWALSDDGDVTSTGGTDDETPATQPEAADTPTTAAPVEPTAPAALPVDTTAPVSAPSEEPTVEIIDLPDGGTATRTESAPAPPTEGVDIGTAVVIERNEAPPAP
jgi:hypothetical protein